MTLGAGGYSLIEPTLFVIGHNRGASSGPRRGSDHGLLGLGHGAIGGPVLGVPSLAGGVAPVVAEGAVNGPAWGMHGVVGEGPVPGDGGAVSRRAPRPVGRLAPWEAWKAAASGVQAQSSEVAWLPSRNPNRSTKSHPQAAVAWRR